MELSNRNKGIILAHKRGYRVNEDGTVTNPKGKRTRGFPTRDGYWEFKIKTDDPQPYVNIPIHRLHCYQKFGDKIFEQGIVCRHLDGNPENNSIDNLEIGTSSDNMMDRKPEDRLQHAIKASSRNRRFTDSQMEEIREFYKKHKSYSKTIEKFGISGTGTLHYMLHNKYVTKK